MDLQDLSTAVQYLLDREAIRDLHARYCRALDRSDLELMKSVFHEDAIEHHAPWFDGRAWEFAAFTIAAVEQGWDQPGAHIVSNEVIEIDGDVAYSEFYVYSINRFEAEHGEADFIFIGRYLSRSERRDGVWRIAERSMVEDLSRIDPVVDKHPPAWPAGEYARGARSRDDLVYSLRDVAPGG